MLFFFVRLVCNLHINCTAFLKTVIFSHTGFCRIKFCGNTIYTARKCGTNITAFSIFYGDIFCDLFKSGSFQNNSSIWFFMIYTCDINIKYNILIFVCFCSQCHFGDCFFNGKLLLCIFRQYISVFGNTFDNRIGGIGTCVTSRLGIVCKNTNIIIFLHTRYFQSGCLWIAIILEAGVIPCECQWCFFIICTLVQSVFP